MKILFKLLGGNKVASNNNAVLVKYIVDEDSLNAAKNHILNKCGFNTGNHDTFIKYAITDIIFKDKVLFIVLPANKEKTRFQTVKALVVRRNDGSICVWSGMYFGIEDGDAVFTNADEAGDLTTELNFIEENKARCAEIEKQIQEQKDAVEAYLDKAHELRQKIVEYANNLDDDGKLIFSLAVRFINNDIENHIKCLDELEERKRFSPFCL